MGVECFKKPGIVGTNGGGVFYGFMDFGSGGSVAGRRGMWILFLGILVTALPCSYFSFFGPLVVKTWVIRNPAVPPLLFSLSPYLMCRYLGMHCYVNSKSCVKVAADVATIPHLIYLFRTGIGSPDL